MGRLLLKEFFTELEEIRNQDLKLLTKKILLDCSDYNSVIAASTSGKYHPPCDLGEGGLIRHTKVVVRLVTTIMKMWPQYDGPDWDILYISAILHDMCKATEQGQEHTHADHPLRMAEKIRRFIPTEQGEYYTDYQDLAKSLERIADNCETHMSRWNTDRDGNEIGKLPHSMENAFLAIADMISAQKYFKADFEGNTLI
jgi:hypothetical protein